MCPENEITGFTGNMHGYHIPVSFLLIIHVQEVAAGYEVVPSVFTSAVPNGEVDIDFYNKIKKEIIETVVAENPENPFQ